jgi:hypothetical protein
MSTESEAEAAIMGAVMSDLTPQVGQPDQQDLDEPTQIDAIEEEGEAQPEAKTEAKSEEPADEEEYLEVEGENGAEPTKLKVAEVYDGYRQFKAIEAQKHEIVERVEREAVEQVTQRMGQVEQFAKETAYAIQGALQLLQPPQAPNPMDPKYEYDQRQYQIDLYKHQQAESQFRQAHGLGQQLLKQAQTAQARVLEERETRELNLLNRAWPEFSKGETVEKFVGDMVKEYGTLGVTKDTLDDALTHHWMALVARDALAYRAMKAQSGDVKAKVEAKAPKLVRSKQEAKGGAQQRDRGGDGKFVAGTYQRAMKSGSDQDWANHFAALSKAGRI